MGNATYLKKDSFATLKTWADGEKSAYDGKIAGDLEQLDGEVEKYLVNFNLLKASKAKSEEAKKAKVYGDVGDLVKEPILGRLNDIRKEYSEYSEYSDRDSLTTKRTSNLDKLTNSIPNYP